MKIFVSYCHCQGEWVWDRLVPCLKAGGAEVLIDRERFEAGKTVVGHMGTLQDQAELHLPVISPQYLASKYCTEELNRAIHADPTFTKGIVVPVLLADCLLPEQLKDALYVDLQNDHNSESWDKLLSACGADLGVDAVHWLAVRDEVQSDLMADRSVNLVVSGKDVAWRPLIGQLAANPDTNMTEVDLYDAQTIRRSGLLACMLSELGGTHNLPPEPQDLIEFQRILESRPKTTRVALKHFDQIQHRDYQGDYFTTLRYLVTEKRKLTLLIQSRVPFDTLLPRESKLILSQMDIKTIELKGQK